jgi:hypothetical protein
MSPICTQKIKELNHCSANLHLEASQTAMPMLSRKIQSTSHLWMTNSSLFEGREFEIGT